MDLITDRRYSCLVNAAAMVFGIDAELMYRNLGCDERAIWWPMLRPPECFRGVHIQEVILVGLQLGILLVRWERIPISRPDAPSARPQLIWDLETCSANLMVILARRNALLISDTHAVAWDGQQVYDPKGAIYGLEHFPLREAYVCGLD